MSVEEIRFLVEGYYDVQKMRIEAFNRIVAYVKSQIENASQNPIETHPKHASHKGSETQTFRASQKTNETHEIFASHNNFEAHNLHASRNFAETHMENASHNDSETQKTGANQSGEGVYAAVARQFLKHPPHEISELVWFHNNLYETEKELAKRINIWSRNHPLRTNYLDHIQGIGPILSSGLIAWLSPISRFPTISKMWKYCGLSPGQKRKHGEKLNYNPRLKTFLWKVGRSFIMQKPENCFYRQLYEEKKAELEKRPDLAEAVRNRHPGAKKHIHLLAMRFTVKRFLADLWTTWRKMEGLPVTEPYSIAVLKHPKDTRNPLTEKKKEKKKRRKRV